MALSVKGTALKFGIGALGLAAPTVAAIGTVQSAELTNENTMNTTARDAGGETVTHVYGDKKSTMRVEGFHTAATIPAVGDMVTVGGVEGPITRATIGATNEDFVKLSAEAEAYGTFDYTP